MYLIRSKPGKIKQTAATKANAVVFGRAVKTASILRKQLAPVIPYNNKEMQNRFQSFVYKILINTLNNTSEKIDPSLIDNFRFNTNAN
jgi:hypothetical protein